MKPERVKRAAEEADNLIKSMQAPVADDPAEGEHADGAEKSTATELSVVASSEPIADEPAVYDSPSAPDTSEQIAELREELRKANARWQTADGIIRSKDQTLEQMREMLAQIKAHNESRQNEQPAQPAKPMFSDADINNFGEDLVQYIHSTATEIAQQMVGPLQDTISKLQGSVRQTEEVTHKTAQERFESKLDEKAPNWRVLDTNDAFIDWLRENAAWQQVFADGVNSLKHDTVANVFTTYEQLTGAEIAQKTVKKQGRQAQLEKQVAPERTRQSSAPAAEESDQKIWTATEIASAYSNRRRKGTRESEMSAEDFDALEREIANAQATGRVDHQS